MTEVSQSQAAIRQASTSLTNATTRREPGKDTLGKEDFLNLLMTQVTHQNPLNPMDSQGMMDQLTAMGSLEQLINLNKRMDEFNATQGQIVRTTAYSFLDKDITINGGRAAVTDGTSTGLQFTLPREAASVNVFITDNDGGTVRKINLGQMAGGSHVVPWDARDDDSDPVASGSYSYNVTAQSGDNQSIPVELFMRGKVSGVKFIDGRPVVLMNGQTVQPKDILEISNRSERLFSGREPRPLMEELQPKAALASKPE
ncbi:MAG: flagellar hook assembly protein FlgD [SAR324 cluster bacterium]|nr:flagellar hook assembly protein FlgD [SAR324 cluster bacterium]